MKRHSEKDFTAREWIIIFGLGGIALAITGFIGVSQKWEDIIVFSIGLFTVLLITLRELWKAPAFWRNLLIIVAAHFIVLTILAQVLPLGRFGFPKLVLIAGGLLEGFLILSFLSKKVGNQIDR